MKKIKLVEVYFADVRVGRLAQTKESICAFEYDAEYLTKGISISPFELPIKNGVMLAKVSPFEGNFGVFDDCLPDGWGLLILDRFLQKQGIQPRTLSILDRLSLVGSTGRGALEFRPDQSTMGNDECVSFDYLAAEIEKILESNFYQGDSIESLYRQGGSPGGARPKISVKFEGKEWLVKFRATSDPKNIGQIEYDYSLLAKRCGVEMPETRLFEGKYFGVVRFDRTPTGKQHVVSAAGLLNADYRVPSLDYLQLFQLCRVLTHNEQELWKLYRLMVFNYLIGNKDDHAKNFAFVLRQGEWHLSPAYDILPGDGMNGYHTTSINESITPTMEDLIAVAQKSGLERNKAMAIFNEISEFI
ncbi:MAG: type II toxin-antitoxin system HipA family toxin [Bacteroidales bacterium]|nr:type II toxin-antitoxin system HipA family toxin [Bacteroidales bacterium]